MIITQISDVFDKFKVSWTSAGLLSFSVPLLEQLFPVFVQICLIFSLQVISIGADYVRKRYDLKERKKSDLQLPRKDDFTDDI